MRYVTFWKNLQTVAGLEKLSESDDSDTAMRARIMLGNMCDHVFTEVKQASAGTEVANTIFAMRNAHRITGEKLAASPEVTAEFIQKLATAVYVDDVLTAQLEKLSGDEYYATRDVQLLGREYAVNLMRGLLA
jgi:hypothetical protein